MTKSARIASIAIKSGRLGKIRASFGADWSWLAVMALATAIEFAWWTATWIQGFAPAPFLLTYLALAFCGLACVLIMRQFFQARSSGMNWLSILIGTILIAVGASAFLPLKYAIPGIVPFWLDPLLAKADRAMFFGADPWLVLNSWLGWAIIPMDRLYGLWLPTQSLVLFALLIQPASVAKSRALIAYVLAWLLLGVVAATVLSSAGPIFHDRLFGGTEFAALHETLESRGAWMVLAESNAMWASLSSGRPGMVAGISAVPSIHVAVSLWIFLVARKMARRLAPVAFCYFAIIWTGSVQLGWHYSIDGLAGALGMLLIWTASGAGSPKTSQRNPDADCQRGHA